MMLLLMVMNGSNVIMFMMFKVMTRLKCMTSISVSHCTIPHQYRLFFDRSAWSSMVEAARNHMHEQLRICNSYVRWKWRQKVIDDW